MQLAALTREAEADRALFNQYLGRLKETNQEQTLRFDNARIVSPALPPLKPSRPGTIILLRAAGLSGLMLSAGAAVFSENVRSGPRIGGCGREPRSAVPWHHSESGTQIGAAAERGRVELQLIGARAKCVGHCHPSQALG